MSEALETTIALDLMGGDGAPETNIQACVQVLSRGVNILALGDERSIAELRSRGSFPNLETQVCSEVISPEEPPVRAVRARRDSTIVQGLMAVKERRAGAFVSAGSTGALAAGGVLLLGRAPGVDKPCLAIVLPAQNGRGVLFADLGASADVRPETLVQFGVMAEIYAEKVLGWRKPRVALLNIGTEDDKGNALTKKAHDLMKDAAFDFYGNIEARDVFSGKADVIITDGFTGNVFLKTCEGTAAFQMSILKRELTANAFRKAAAAILRPAFKKVKETLDYSVYGGAPLLGLMGGVVKCHGSSDATAVANGIYQAQRFLGENCASLISDSLLKMGLGSKDKVSGA